MFASKNINLEFIGGNEWVLMVLALHNLPTDVQFLFVEAMWTCYVTFCLERYKRKTNVTELKEKVMILVFYWDAAV